MCNAIAFRLHIGTGGDEAYLHRRSHPIVAEAGGPAALSGAVLCPLDGERGMFTADALRAALRPAGDRYLPRSRLVSVEQTTNLAGGHVWPRGAAPAVVDVARERGAAAAHGRRAADERGRGQRARPRRGPRGFDTAWVDFSKGLGAPVGACLAGSRALIDEAWRYKQMWGGAMRQAGIVAAGALYALDHHVERLAEDHAQASGAGARVRLGAGRGARPGGGETNIVVFEVADAPALVAALAERGREDGRARPDARCGRSRTSTSTPTGVERAVEAVRASRSPARAEWRSSSA